MLCTKPISEPGESGAEYCQRKFIKKANRKGTKHRSSLSARNGADFSVFNLTTTEYMKYISHKREREMVLCLDSHPLGLRAPAFPQSASPASPQLTLQCSPLGCCGNDYGAADRRLPNLGSGVTSRKGGISTEQQSRFVQI